MNTMNCVSSLTRRAENKPEREKVESSWKKSPFSTPYWFDLLTTELLSKAHGHDGEGHETRRETGKKAVL